MAICYKCGESFFGYACDCGWIAKYKCWSCGSSIEPEGSNHCKDCGWYECNECEQCGCNEDRPLSNQEKLNGEY